MFVARKPKVPRVRIVFSTIFLLSLVTIALLIQHGPLLTTLRLPHCGHVVLVSSQRHGSAWFISNAEHCLSRNGSYGDLNRNTEIWNHGWVRRITLEEAVRQLHNTSIKIFPRALYEHEEDLRALLGTVRELGLPVFVLRRRLTDVQASLVAAKRMKAWNDDTGGADDRPAVQGPWYTALRNTLKRNGDPGGAVGRKAVRYARYMDHRNKTNKYFEDVQKVLREVGLSWDEVSYETIVGQRLVVSTHGKCYIRNCNF